MPDKVTLKWLWDHVPWHVWVSLVGLLATAFALGIAFSETNLYKSLKPDATPNVKHKSATPTTNDAAKQ